MTSTANQIRIGERFRLWWQGLIQGSRAPTPSPTDTQNKDSLPSPQQTNTNKKERADGNIFHLKTISQKAEEYTQLRKGQQNAPMFDYKLPSDYVINVDACKKQGLENNMKQGIVLSCSVQNTVQDVVFLWTKDGIELFPRNRIQIESNQYSTTLSIDEPEPTDAGLYKCVAANPDGRCECSTRVVINVSEIEPTVGENRSQTNGLSSSTSALSETRGGNKPVTYPTVNESSSSGYVPVLRKRLTLENSRDAGLSQGITEEVGQTSESEIEDITALPECDQPEATADANNTGHLVLLQKPVRICDSGSTAATHSRRHSIAVKPIFGQQDRLSSHVQLTVTDRRKSRSFRRPQSVLGYYPMSGFNNGVIHVTDRRNRSIIYHSLRRSNSMRSSVRTLRKERAGSKDSITTVQHNSFERASILPTLQDSTRNQNKASTKSPLIPKLTKNQNLQVNCDSVVIMVSNSKANEEGEDIRITASNSVQLKSIKNQTVSNERTEHSPLPENQSNSASLGEEAVALTDKQSKPPMDVSVQDSEAVHNNSKSGSLPKLSILSKREVPTNHQGGTIKIPSSSNLSSSSSNDPPSPITEFIKKTILRNTGAPRSDRRSSSVLECSTLGTTPLSTQRSSSNKPIGKIAEITTKSVKELVIQWNARTASEHTSSDQSKRISKIDSGSNKGHSEKKLDKEPFKPEQPKSSTEDSMNTKALLTQEETVTEDLGLESGLKILRRDNTSERQSKLKTQEDMEPVEIHEEHAQTSIKVAENTRNLMSPRKDAVQLSPVEEPVAPNVNPSTLLDKPSGFFKNTTEDETIHLSFDSVVRKRPKIDAQLVNPTEKVKSIETPKVCPSTPSSSTTPVQLRPLSILLEAEENKLKSGEKHAWIINKSAAPAKVEDTQLPVAPFRDSKDTVEYPLDIKTERELDPTTHFDYGDCIGRGQFGKVQTCYCKKTGKQYAVKTFRTPRLPRHKGEIMEVAVLKAIGKHPQIAHLVAAYEIGTMCTIVTEYVPGGALFERIRDDGELDEIITAQIIRQVLSGLRHLKNCRVLHCDLKPENLMMCKPKGYELKIIDFGLACFYEQTQTARRPAGTLTYLAPETQNYDPQSYATDLWSVAVIAYELLSGITPFEVPSQGDPDRQLTSEEISLNITMVRYSMEEEGIVDASPEAKDFIKRILVRNPKARPTVEECLQHTWITMPDFNRPVIPRKVSLYRHSSQRHNRDAIRTPIRAHSCRKPDDPGVSGNWRMVK